MLDILISYINYLILSLKYIVKLIVFLPPNPKGFRIKNTKNEIKAANKNLSLSKDDILEILVVLPNKNVNKKDELNYLKGKNNNNEIIIIKNEYYQYKPITNRDANYQLIYINNVDNKTLIPAFLFKANQINNCNINANNYIIIYCHGNCGDIGSTFFQCNLLSKKILCDVLSFEYPGYGYSIDIGNINEKRANFNLRQAYNYSRNELKYKPENIIIFGYSLGTGLAFDLACDKNYPIGGVILQSAFLSIIRIIYNFKKTYYFDLFNNCDKAKLCNSKIFFIHGDKDRIVPYVHGRILSQLIPKKLLYDFFTVKGADHHNIIEVGKNEYYEKINKFINSLKENKQQHQAEKCSDSINTIIKNFKESDYSDRYKKKYKRKIIFENKENAISKDFLKSYEKENSIPPIHLIKHLHINLKDIQVDIENNNEEFHINENT